MVRGYRLSSHWQRNRRAHHKLTAPIFSECQRCGQPKLSHRICGNCGHYERNKRGKKSMEMIVDMKKV